jgi:hypothetical protein
MMRLQRQALADIGGRQENPEAVADILAFDRRPPVFVVDVDALRDRHLDRVVVLVQEPVHAVRG